MWAMSRRMYKWLTTSLMMLSVIFFLGSILVIQTDWLKHVDFAIKLAIFPGGLIADGILFLINGCVEHYADCLPSKYRKRPSTRSKWEATYSPEEMYSAESVLKQFARSHGFRITDAFQFGPDDRIEDLMREFYPGRSDTDTLFRRSDLTTSMANAPTRLCLREYVTTRIDLHHEKERGCANTTTENQESSSTRIDRQARNRLVNTICRYMGETLSAFAFDEEIYEIRRTTADETVHYVVDSLWLHYDDCKDHLAGLSKPEWDYFQRLTLLLESDAEIERVHQRHWSVRQIVAGIGLIAFGLCVYRFGIGWHLFGFALLFGPLSILLSYWRNHSKRWQDEERSRLIPFSSISELRAIRKTVSGFSKRRYPVSVKARRVHSRLMTIVVWFQTAVLWSFMSPLILLFQALPEKEISTRIHQNAAELG